MTLVLPCVDGRRYSPGTAPGQAHDDSEWLKRGKRRAGGVLKREMAVTASPTVRGAGPLAQDSEQQAAETEAPRAPLWAQRPSQTDSIRVAAIGRSNRLPQPVRAFGRD